MNVTQKSYLTDFAPTLVRLLHVDGNRDATGRVLQEILEVD